jgi:hypothetical protein
MAGLNFVENDAQKLHTLARGRNIYQILEVWRQEHRPAHKNSNSRKRVLDGVLEK